MLTEFTVVDIGISFFYKFLTRSKWAECEKSRTKADSDKKI